MGKTVPRNGGALALLRQQAIELPKWRWIVNADGNVARKAHKIKLIKGRMGPACGAPCDIVVALAMVPPPEVCWCENCKRVEA